ncbi:MAG: ABC transporter permease [Clostridiales Family XIII bacterium]|jgi:ribose/xylose/arabinose/galactoside ABC-type transport system permease subunit|nr:ABC transporter permease [Clostridiales Family XIII bacterium]
MSNKKPKERNIASVDEQSWVRRFLGSKMFTLLAVLIVVIVIFSIWAELVGNRFFSGTTLRNILNSLVVSSFLTIGAGCLLISGEIDLSQAAVGAFGGIVIAMAVTRLNLVASIGIVLTLVLCGVFGLINAVLVNEFRFPSFIGTLAMASVAKGLMTFMSLNESGSSTNVPFNDATLKEIATGTIGGFLPKSILIMIAAFIIYGVILSKTRFGRKIYMVGGNRIAARMAGINAKAISYILFVNCAVLGGVAGIMYSARIGQGVLQALQTNQFTGLTAAILGGIMFGGGSGGLGGAFVGLAILITFQSGMTIVNVSPYWMTTFTGVLLIAALALDYSRTKKMQNALGMD